MREATVSLPRIACEELRRTTHSEEWLAGCTRMKAKETNALLSLRTIREGADSRGGGLVDTAPPPKYKPDPAVFSVYCILVRLTCQGRTLMLDERDPSSERMFLVPPQPVIDVLRASVYTLAERAGIDAITLLGETVRLEHFLPRSGAPTE